MFNGQVASVSSTPTARHELDYRPFRQPGGLAAAGSHTRAHVGVKVSGAFYGWLAQFGPLVRVEKPQTVVQGYTAYLQEIVDSYR